MIHNANLHERPCLAPLNPSLSLLQTFLQYYYGSQIYKNNNDQEVRYRA